MTHEDRNLAYARGRYVFDMDSLRSWKGAPDGSGRTMWYKCDCWVKNCTEWIQTTVNILYVVVDELYYQALAGGGTEDRFWEVELSQERTGRRTTPIIHFFSSSSSSPGAPVTRNNDGGCDDDYHDHDDDYYGRSGRERGEGEGEGESARARDSEEEP